jgi:large subunit ribosomal protein L28
LQNKRIWDPEAKKWIRIKLTAKAIKTIDKKGLRAMLNEAK